MFLPQGVVFEQKVVLCRNRRPSDSPFYVSGYHKRLLSILDLLALPLKRKRHKCTKKNVIHQTIPNIPPTVTTTSLLLSPQPINIKSTSLKYTYQIIIQAKQPQTKNSHQHQTPQTPLKTPDHPTPLPKVDLPYHECCGPRVL